MLFLVSGPRALGLKTLCISSANVKEFWRIQILASGTEDTIITRLKFCIFVIV
jgi:hypothetical protein